MRHKFLFVQLFLLTLSISSLSLANLDSDDELPAVQIQAANNFQKDAIAARDKQRPILIIFSMEGCAYCEYVEEEHLKPMLRNANYRSKVIIRRVMVDDHGDVIDFNGKPISTDHFASRYGASLTPTVVFVDDQGNQLVPRILGVRNTEFYGYDLDRGLDLSLMKVRKKLAQITHPGIKAKP